ncbi:MAG TPA: hypothetical protein VK875_06260, partial [Euzebyales bacterium]|nr:hypothetical protein [Euzebyales bacterium]
MVAPDNAFEGSGAGTRGPAIARPAAPLVFGYAAYGAYWGAWAVMFAEYLAHRDLSMAAAGGLFSVTSVTAIATMVLIGGPAVRWPRARTTAVAFCLSAAGGIAVALADGAWLIPAFGLLGLGIGLVDVLVNIAGAELEARTRRPVLQIVHAAYGLGGGVAAVLTAVAVGRGATAA